MDKKSIVNDLYQAAVISVLAVGYLMLGKKILCVLHQAFKSLAWKTQENLVAIVAGAVMTRDYFIKQKILRDHINVLKWLV